MNPITADAIEFPPAGSLLGEFIGAILYDGRTHTIVGTIDHDKRFHHYTGPQPVWPWPSREGAWVEQDHTSGE